VGGVMVTLAALCLASGIDMYSAAERELARINQPEIVAKIRTKQAAKPTGSALPVAQTLSLSSDPTQPWLEVVEAMKYDNSRLRKAVRLCLKNQANNMARGELFQIMAKILAGDPCKRFDELTDEGKATE